MRSDPELDFRSILAIPAVAREPLAATLADGESNDTYASDSLAPSHE